jgi:hypothetical protein
MPKPTKLTKVSEKEFYSDSSFVSGLSNDELAAHVQATRDRIAATLDEVEDKVNVGKQVERAKDRLQVRLTTMKQEQPLVLAAIGLGAVAVAGLIITAVVKGTARR